MKRAISLGLLFAAALIHADANANPCVPSTNTRCNVDLGLDLIDGADDGRYYYAYNGAGVDIYIVDDGIDPAVALAAFGQRYAEAENFSSAPDDTDGTTTHGFDMANAAAGAQMGVASGANIRLLRVNTITDTNNASLKDALAWLRDEKIKLDGPGGQASTPLRRQSVVSISLTRAHDPAVNALIAEVVGLGLPVFVSAGNKGLNGTSSDGQNACGFSPAGEPSAFTVSAGSAGYSREYFANYGSCVDGFVYAAEIGGTSQSTARAAGVAALIWQQNPMLTGAGVIAAMQSRAQVGTMADTPFPLNGSQNLVVTSVPPAAKPPFFGVSNKLCYGRNTLQWLDSGPEILAYELQSSANSQFSAPVLVYAGLNQSLSVDVGITTYYRVRACNSRGCSAYTNGNRAATYTPSCQ